MDCDDLLYRGLPTVGHTLLLYTLLQAHHTFAEVLLANNQLQAIVEGLLRGVCLVCDTHGDVVSTVRCGTTEGLHGESYKQSPTADSSIAPPSFDIDHLYILIICILLLVQDRTLCASMQHVSINATWLKGNAISLHEVRNI